MVYHSPTYGEVNLRKLKEIISKFMAENKNAHYQVVIGSDSQEINHDKYDFVSAIVIHRVGYGGIYFWRREIKREKMGLKQRIYREAIMSLETSEKLIGFFKKNGISKYDIQIHIDIGTKGETRVLINELIGMVRGSGYKVKIKPESYGAAKVADKYT